MATKKSKKKAPRTVDEWIKQMTIWGKRVRLDILKLEDPRRARGMPPTTSLSAKKLDRQIKRLASRHDPGDPPPPPKPKG